MRAFIITRADVDRCPKGSLAVGHYREDGSCRCDERVVVKAELAQAALDLRTLRMRVRQLRNRLFDC